MDIAMENSPLIHHGGNDDLLSSSDDGGFEPGQQPKKPVRQADKDNNTQKSSIGGHCASRQQPMLAIGGILGGIALIIIFTIVHGGWRHYDNQQHSPVDDREQVNIAFVGNSMFYFNDFPRFFQVLASPRRFIYQNSCLHAKASIPSLLLEGNDMYPQFATPHAIIRSNKTMHYPYKHHTIYDYGACTVELLLTGNDPRLDDPGYAIPEEKNATNKNPCREDAIYLEYAREYFADLLQTTSTSSSPSFHWDYILIDDYTQNPARRVTRGRSLNFLESFYVPWLLQTKATPVFLWTHAYSVVESTVTQDIKGLEDIANFTSLTYVGYQEYAKLLDSYLPAHQKTRIAPVGLAFLLVYEERPDVWSQLFHSDHVHASPSGTFLQGCVIHYTLFGEMPPKDWAVRSSRRGMKSLWETARMMQHAYEPPNPFPGPRMAEYLYGVAERIMVDGVIPKTFIAYHNGETAYEETNKTS